jgi:hypothetical protein
MGENMGEPVPPGNGPIRMKPIDGRRRDIAATTPGRLPPEVGPLRGATGIADCGGPYYAWGGMGDARIVGGDGVDTASYAGSDAGVTVNLGIKRRTQAGRTKEAGGDARLLRFRGEV